MRHPAFWFSLSFMAAWLPGSQARPVPQAASAVPEPELVKELGSPDFARREAATRALLGQGDAAGEALARAASESPDPEVRMRAREILDRIGWASPEDRARIEALAQVLKTTRDIQAGAEAFRGLSEAGRAGQKALRELFPERAGPAKLSVEIRVERRTFRRAEPILSKAVVRNAGDEPVWLRPASLGVACHPVEEVVRAVAEKRNAAARAFPKQFALEFALEQDSGFHLFQPEEPPFEVVRLPPGGSLEADLRLDEAFTDVVGPLPIFARYYVPASGSGLGLAQNAENAPGGAVVAPSPTTALAQSAVERVFVLPREGASVPGVSVSVEPAAAGCVAGGGLPVEIVLAVKEPAGLEVEAAPPGLPPGGMWAAILDARGEVVHMVRWGRGAGPTRLLKPGEPLRAKAVLTAPSRPGSYRLTAGFTVAPAPVPALAVDAAVEPLPVASALSAGDAVAPERQIAVK